MEPAFQRGDILFLNNQDDPIRAGEIVVFKIKDRDIPIVHRALKVHERADGGVEVLTKGRHDPCVGIRGVPVVEAMMALVLADHKLLHRGQCG